MKYSQAVTSGVRQLDVERDAVIRSLLLGERLSLGVTDILAARFGVAVSGNRDVQTVLSVHATPGITPSGLAAVTGMSSSAVSRSLSRLAGAGLVVARVATHDARSETIRLTRGGRARIGRVDLEVDDWLRGEAPTIKELVHLLGLDVAVPRGASPAGGLALVAQLATAGQAYIDEVTPVLASFGVHDASQRYALTLLLDRAIMRPSDLAEELGLSSSGASDLIARLESAGIVRRDHDFPSDRRAVSVSLTARGVQAATAKVDVFARHVRTVMAPLAATTQPQPEEH